ncbi:hypothetical protein, partial [Halorhodospira abdelmalekii]|uniref:hypothetical protein n=1 Tax=Halorhodospira abdelmalekii TaxID=421629 RepID=UPI001908C649
MTDENGSGLRIQREEAKKGKEGKAIRMSGPELEGNRNSEMASATMLARSFAGALIDEVGRKHPYVGREIIAHTQKLQDLQESEEWPRTVHFTAEGTVLRPEKASPHGAVVLSTSPLNKHGDIVTSTLDWGVFLPIGNALNIKAKSPAVRLMLHGYFFVDSGRRNIKGFDQSVDLTDVQLSWNCALRDEAVLPLLPGVLYDAFQAEVFTSNQLAELLSVFSETALARTHAAAIAKNGGLARVIRRTGNRMVATWSLTAADAALRSFPEPDQGRVAAAELFNDLAEWAEARGLFLIAGPNAALLRDLPRWTADEIADLLDRLDPATFVNDAGAEALAAFLETAVDDNSDLRDAAGPPLLSALRRAITDDRSLAPEETMRRILRVLPLGSAVALSGRAGERFVLRALARASGSSPVVRSEWLESAQVISSLSPDQAAPLLSALQPLLEGGDYAAESVVTASLSIVRLMAAQLQEAVRHPSIAPLSVLRVFDGSGQSRLASLADLVEAARERRLFRSNPNLTKTLKVLHEAAPGSGAIAVSATAADLLEGIGDPVVFTDATSKKAIARLVMRAERLGPPEARGRLLDTVFTADEAARPALRVLVAGDHRAANKQISLIALGNGLGVLDRLVRDLIDEDTDTLVVPAAITMDIGYRRKQSLGIEDLDAAALGELLRRNAQRLRDRPLDSSMLKALFNSNLEDADLRALPLFTDTSGQRRCGDEIWRDTPDAPIPESMRGVVPVLAPSTAKLIQTRVEQLIDAWSPAAQIRIALEQPEPHHFANEIVSALAKTAPNDLDSLRHTAWLRDHHGRPWKPIEILDLPAEVMEVARTTLAQGNNATRFLPLDDLAPILREPETAQILRDTGVLFDAQRMESELIQRIKIVRPVAIFSEWRTATSSRALARLASSEANLRLPGWPLLAALLRSSSEHRQQIIEAFGQIEHESPDLAADALSALAKLATDGSEEAWTVYVATFKTVALWAGGARRATLGNALVRTQDATWRLGREVSVQGGGVAASRLLHQELGALLQERASGGGTEIGSTGIVDPRPPREANLQAFEKEAIEGLRDILEYAKPHVPPDLLILLVGLLGCSEGFAELARDAIDGSEADLKRIWRRLDDEVAKVFRPTNKHASLQDRRKEIFVIPVPVRQAPSNLKVETLSGETQELPVADLTPLGVLGDLHQSGFTYTRGPGMLRRQPIKIGIPADRTPSAQSVHDLCLALAEIIIGYRSEQSDAFIALDALAESCNRVEQTLVESVRDELEDRLPSILDELKPRRETHLRQARDTYKQEISAIPCGEARESARQRAKEALWQAVNEPGTRNELLAAVRGRIEDYGYDAKRVLFELFQNADDATSQHPPVGETRFRLEAGESRIRTLHWGRELNHHGPSREKGAREGWSNDLLNMLLLNVSDKADGVTGRFGLGFKCVHLIAGEVGIASRFVACRVHGGMLPDSWSGGRELSFQYQQGSRAATVIDLELDSNTATNDAVSAFRLAARWLPAMSRAIRSIEIAGDAPRHVEYDSLVDGIGVVRLIGPEPGRALALDLGDETTLFIPLDAYGPAAASPETPRLWLMAPLEESVQSGWLLNCREFRVDPGRGRLAGTEEERRALFATLGDRLGHRLIAIFDLLHEDPSILIDATASGDEVAQRFLNALFEFFAGDVRDYGIVLKWGVHSTGSGVPIPREAGVLFHRKWGGDSTGCGGAVP